MFQLKKLLQHPWASRIFLGVLAIVYVAYLGMFGRYLVPSVFAPTETIIEHTVTANPNTIIKHWTAERMRGALDADKQIGNKVIVQQTSARSSAAQSGLKDGQPPLSGDSSYPLSTVGKLFFTNDSGQDMVCSGTAVVSDNKSVVDTAGHCLYWNGAWVQNVLFCPLYDHGKTPYGCWAARDLEVPADWIDSGPYDLHHDMGMAIVTPNSQGYLTDLVGGAGWAYNQRADQPFYAYGYPAAPPFDGQSRKACDQGAIGKTWAHGGGTVVSIPCNMTGGSSGGPWFIEVKGKRYLNGHNDFISSIQPGHMFSPYYDDTWFALYEQAQDS
jgi:V8-like Glu-specific endopeptidase